MIPTTIAIIGAEPTKTSSTALFEDSVGLTLTCRSFCPTLVPSFYQACYVQVDDPFKAKTPQCIAMKLGETRTFAVNAKTPSISVLTKGVATTGDVNNVCPAESVTSGPLLATCARDADNFAEGYTQADAFKWQSSVGCGSSVELNTEALGELLQDATTISMPLSHGIYTLSLTQQKHVDASLAPLIPERSKTANRWAPLFSSFMPLRNLPATEESALSCFNALNAGPSNDLYSTQLPPEVRSTCFSSGLSKDECGKNPSDWRWVRLQVPTTTTLITTTRVSWFQNLIAALGGFWSLITLVLGIVVTLILAGVDAIATAVEKKQNASNTAAAAEGGDDDDAAAAVNPKEEMQERRAARPEVEMVESRVHTGAAHKL